jgi:PST family polysaccharide transporter
MSFTRSDRDLGGRVLRGAAFLAGARLFVRFFSLINLVVLTRLLAPADFGIAALAVTAIGFLQAFSDVKVNNALIAFDDLGQSHLDTAYTLGLIRGLVLAGLLLGGAGPIARFMDAPALEPVLEVMSVILLIDGIKNPAFLVYERNVDFSKEFRRQTLATLVASLAGIAAAFYFRSYWAIVVSSVIERVLQLALSYWRIPYRPKFGLAAWRSFLGFSGWLMLQGMLTQLASMATRVLIGKLSAPKPSASLWWRASWPSFRPTSCWRRFAGCCFRPSVRSSTTSRGCALPIATPRPRSSVWRCRSVSA